MSITSRIQAALQAFRNPNSPVLGIMTARTTETLLNMFEQREKNLSAKTREQVKRNPYVYAALRNTADELVGYWNGASGYTPRDTSEKHLRRPPQILAASTLGLHQQQAEHLRWNIDYRLKRGWENVIRALLHSREDGKAVLELKWAWQPNGPWKGSWVIDDILHCNPDHFNFAYNKVVNELTGEVNYERVMYYNPFGGLGGTPTPPGKFLLYSFDRSYENDEGNSILNKLDIFDWYQRNNFIFWMTDLNRYGSPIIRGTYPRGSTEPQIQALLDAIDSIQQETGIAIPEDQTIEILQATRNGVAGFELLNQIINAIIAVVIAGNALALESGGQGSYALAKATAAEIRQIILHALATNIDQVFNHQLIYWWMTYNYPRTMEYPRHQLLPPRDNNSVAEQVQNSNSSQVSTMSASSVVPALHYMSEALSPSEQLAMTAASQSLNLVEEIWITPISTLLKSSTISTLSNPSIILSSFNPDFSKYEDLLARSFVTAHILGRWQVTQEVNQETLSGRSELSEMSDSEINNLLLSPLELEKAREIVLSKELMSKREFQRLTDQAKRTAFTVAGQEDERIQALIRQAIADAIADGILEGKEFEKRARDAFRRYGVTAQTPFHAETVFRTNIQSVLHDARWQMIQSPDMREQIAYLKYVTKEDSRVRPSHRRMHGVIRPVDDSVWQIWWPPNGFNCRCAIYIITWTEAEQRGIISTPVLPRVSPDDGFENGPGQWVI